MRQLLFHSTQKAPSVLWLFHELRVAVRLLYLGSYCIVLDQILMKNKQDKQNTDRGFRNKVVPHLSLSRPLPLG